MAAQKTIKSSLNRRASDGRPLFQVHLDENVIKAIRIMAAYKEMHIKHYLNNFFKDFIVFEAQNTSDPLILKAVKEKLDKVGFDQ